MSHHHENSETAHGAELVSYIYGELEQSARQSFEAHLAVCDECAFELAAFSDARLGVIEWRREDFDQLATPEIIVPVGASAHARGNHSSAAGRFLSLLGSLMPRPVVLRAAFGSGIAIAALIVGMTYFRPVTSPDVKPQVAVVEEDLSAKTTSKPKAIEDSAVAANEDLNIKVPVKREAHRATVTRPDERNVRSQRSATVRKPPRAQTATAKLPRLNNFDEEEDRSLRLSDLFAEIGNTEE